MTPPARPIASRFGLAAAIGLVVVALAATTAVRIARLTGPNVTARPAAAPVNSIELVFIDQPNGAIEVRSGEDRRLVQLIRPATGGFVRGVMRGFARDRQSRGVGAGPPFLLAQSPTGQLSLTDMATGRVTVLDAFGSVNRAAFATMLPQRQAGGALDANTRP